MKKALFGLYCLITVFCLFYGGILALVNLSRNVSLSITYAIIFGIGVVLFIPLVIYTLIKKKKKDNKESP